MKKPLVEGDHRLQRRVICHEVLDESSTVYLSTQQKKIELVKQMWTWYCTQLHNYPLLTKCATACFVASAGDMLAQCVAQTSNTTTSTKFAGNYDLGRTVRFGIYGACIGAPFSHHWNRFLDARIVAKRGSILSLNSAVFKKTVLDQVIANPLMTAVFFLSIGVMEQMQFKENQRRLEQSWRSTVLISYTIWPAVSFCSFALIPIHFRTIFTSTVGLGWGAYMSYSLSTANKEGCKRADNECACIPHQATSA